MKVTLAVRQSEEEAKPAHMLAEENGGRNNLCDEDGLSEHGIKHGIKLGIK